MTDIAPSTGSSGASSSPSTSTPSAPTTSAQPSKPAAVSAPAAPQDSNSFREAIRSGANPFSSPEVNEDSVDFTPDESENEFEDAPEEDAVEEQEETPAEDDWSWAEQLRDYKDGLHGVQLQELLAALKNGSIPEALFDKLTFEMKDGENVTRETLRDMQGGRLRHNAFTRRMQELSNERNQFQGLREKHNGEIKQFADYVQSWKGDDTGATLLAAAEKMGLPIDGMARLYATRLAELERVQELETAGQLPQGTADRLKQSHATQQQLAQEKAERARFERLHNEREQGETQAKEAAQTKQVTSAIENAAMQTFKQINLDMTEGSWELFKGHLRAIWGQTPGALPTQQMIRDASIATQQDVSERVAKHRAKPQAPKQAAPAAVSRSLDGGSPTKSTFKNPNAAMTSADFKKQLASGKFTR